MRKALALLLAVGLLLLGTAWWTARQGARLPDWFVEAEAAGELDEDLAAAARRARQSLVGRFGRELLDEVTADDGTPDESFFERIKRRGKMVLDGLKEGREVRLAEADLENLILATVDRDEQGKALLEATRAVHAEIQDGELELGAVVTPSKLPTASLDEAQQRLLDLALRLAGSDGDVYVGLRAPPRAFEERLLLGPPVTLLVGKIELGPALVTALGLAGRELEEGLVLDVGRLRVREVRIEGEALVLVVSPDL